MADAILADLHAYYDAHGIGALNFACPHHQQCAADSPRFTTAKEAYVGPEYEAGTLPRLLFLSLDSGSADPDPATKTLEANREGMRAANVASFPRGRHWYETHELALTLLRPFKPDLTIEQVGPYFAHTNSAKCCQNNPGRALAAETLFRNCRRFIPEEVRILRPDILVTQGDFARDAIAGAFGVESRTSGGEGRDACVATVLRLSDTHRTISFHTYHPSAYGSYWRQKTSCWPFFVQSASTFLADRWRSHDAPRQPVPSKMSVTATPAHAGRSMDSPQVGAPTRLRTAGAGDQGLDLLVTAFSAVFGVTGRPFGTAHGPDQGVSDNAQGVQWNAGVDRRRGAYWLGVNLEGMAYDDWPIARLIERELHRPTFLDLCGHLPQPSVITMSWFRDAWQASARLPITELHIGPTPMTLDRISPDIWRAILLEAYGCLNPDKNHRGRARQTVTLKSGVVERWVTPHLHLAVDMRRTPPRSQDEAEALMRQGRGLLLPVYEFVKDRVA